MLKTADQLVAQGKTVTDFYRNLEIRQPTYISPMEAGERREAGRGKLKDLEQCRSMHKYRASETPRTNLFRPPSICLRNSVNSKIHALDSQIIHKEMSRR